jgi:predicted Ser/Thr protein kinase
MRGMTVAMLRVAAVAPTEREPERTHAAEHQALRPRRPRVVETAATGPTPPWQGPRRLAVGQQLGDRYAVMGFLGKGGMGAVYRVFDRVLDKQVALKVVRTDDASLRGEVRLAQQVAHHNVCRTYDLESIDGQHYVKMEYIAGETLEQRLSSAGRLSITRAIEIVRAVAAGLAAAHARGIVHRDLKPANVMLADDRVVLVDFGLAQFEGATDLAGTPGYMSPEQLAGRPIDARADLYALGCVAFEALTGEAPFGTGTIREVTSRQSKGPPPDLRALRPDVPRWLASAVAALLARDPHARERGATLLETGPGPWKRAIPILVAALVAGIAAAVAMRPAPAWQPAIADLPQFDENADDPSFSPDGKSYVYSSDRGHRDVWAVYLGADGNAEPRRISPPGTFCVSGRWMRDGRAIVMSCYVGGERRILRQSLDGSPVRDLGPGWSADDCGDSLAVVVSRPVGAALVMRDRDGRDADLAQLPGISFARCDPSGQHVAYVEGVIDHPGFGGDLVVVDRRGTTRKLTSATGVDGASFTADGNAIVFAMQRGSASSLFEEPIAGGAIRELAPREDYACAPDVARDGTSLIFDRDRTSVPLFELGSGAAIQRTFRLERLSHVVAAPSGRTIVAAKLDHRELSIVAIDLADFTERTLTRGEALFVTRDDEVMFRSNDDPRRLQSIRLRGGVIATLATLPSPIVDGADGPDGWHLVLDRDGVAEAWLVTRDGAASPEGISGLVMPAPSGGWRVVRVANGVAATLHFVPPGGSLASPTFSRNAAWGEPAWVDDRTFAYCELTVCHRLDVTTGRDVETTPIDVPGNRPITVGRDGKRWFVTSYVGHVTRHVITNFGARPWK